MLGADRCLGVGIGGRDGTPGWLVSGEGVSQEAGESDQWGARVPLWDGEGPKLDV